ncbi:MAG TPA: rhodanese-like domain-containing protein, partial [Gemmatimonadales bacterium]|nr:rhodanese-like domain-containing protein [Gemmatimonadales bacterium]
LLLDGLKLRFRELVVRRDPLCPACGEHPTITAPIDYEAFCGERPEQLPGVEISPDQLDRELASGNVPQVVDVREGWEWEIARIDGSVLIPLRELGDRMREVDPHRPVVMVCHHGIRSLTARELLRAAGYRDVRSLAGGIEAWAGEVDQEMARY